MFLYEDRQEKLSVRQEVLGSNGDGHESSKLNQYNSKTQINDKVRWLQNKVQKQSAQILSLSNQLKRQSKIKEHTQRLLLQQKQKSSRTNNSNSTANRHNRSIKSQLNSNFTVDSDRKIVHMVDKIRKKNTKVDENTKHSNNCQQLQKDIEGLREVFINNQSNQASLLQQVKLLKNQVRQKDQQISQAYKQVAKVKMDYQLLRKDMYTQQQEIQTIHADTKQIMNRQNQEIFKLQSQLAYQYPQSKCHIKENCNLRIAKSQMRRALATHLKDDNMRKKIQLQMLVVLQGACAKLNHTSRALSTARQ